MVIEKASTRTRLAWGVLFGRDPADPALLEWVERRPQQARQAVRALWHASDRLGAETGPPAAPPEPALLTPVLVESHAGPSTVDWHRRSVLVLGDGGDLAIAVDGALRAAGARTECVTLRETVRMHVDERAGQIMTAAEVAKRLRDEPQPDWLFVLSGYTAPRTTGLAPVDAVHVRPALGALREVLAARPGGPVAAVTALDGRFGATGAVPLDPVAGALPGLLRGLGHVPSRVLDVAASVDLREVARELLAFADGPADHRELGFDGTTRVTPSLAAARLGRETGLPLEPGSTVVAAGGARGRSADVLVAMAREVPCRYVLLGRTPLVNIYAALGVGDRDHVLSMSAEEFDGHRTRQRESLRANPDFSEEAFEAYWARLARSFDVMRTIGRMRDAGAQVEYVQQDVTDSHAVRRLGQELRARGLRIHGLVHAAAHGDESGPEAWDRTIATRINGFYHLVPLLDDQVRLVALLGCAGGSAESAGSGFLVPLADRLAAEFPRARIRAVRSAAAPVITAALRAPQAPRTLVPAGS